MQLILRLNILTTIFLALGCVHTATAQSNLTHDPRFPDTWWQEAPRDGAPEWEILPQDALPGEVILSKRTELGILSNFAATPFDFRGSHYASLEGFWQMMKYPEGPLDPRSAVAGVTWPHTRSEVAAMTSFTAKTAGDFGSNVMKQMGINWVTFEGHQMTYHTTEKGEHYDLIVAATWAKLEQNPAVKDILLRTGDLVLKPDHIQEANASPAWEYFKIYMDIRRELQAAIPH